MTFDANGTLSGTLTEAGNFVVNFVLTDAADKTLRSGRSFEVFTAEGRSDQTVWEAARSYKVELSEPHFVRAREPSHLRSRPAPNRVDAKRRLAASRDVDLSG
jgi:hypothetical protein